MSLSLAGGSSLGRAALPALGENCYSRPMIPRANFLAAGAGWSATEVLCTEGPLDRPYEEQHEQICVAAVVSGTFQYRTRQGSATMVPGALLLGNAGACFECGHAHGTGDRCLSFRLDPDWFAEVAASIRGARQGAFSMPRLPPSEASLRLIAAVETARGDVLALEEVALRIAGIVLLAQERASLRPSSTRDEKRVSQAIRLIEDRPEAPHTLAGLARAVSMSPYHFLRTFRAVAGVTPYQFILGQRLRWSAMRLRETASPIAGIAFEAGFGDLSTFNRRFRRVMGMTPGAWRSRP